jgi:hypothetical protein
MSVLHLRSIQVAFLAFPVGWRLVRAVNRFPLLIISSRHFFAARLNKRDQVPSRLQITARNLTLYCSFGSLFVVALVRTRPPKQIPWNGNTLLVGLLTNVTLNCHTRWQSEVSQITQLLKRFVVSVSTSSIASYKVVQILPGQTVTCLHTNIPGQIWTTFVF